jgi:small-conductance mechanosensitive channel
MRKLMSVPLVCLWALAVTLPLPGDDKPGANKDAEKQEVGPGKEKVGAEKTTREARIKELMQQMEKIQRALAEESQALSAGDLKEKQQKMTAEMRKMQEEMQRQMQQRGAAFPPGGAIGGLGDPSQMALQQMKMMLQNLENFGGALPAGMPTGDHDPVEIGQKMVIAGLEVQLKGLAGRINATEDKEAKQKLTSEFREIVEQVVEGRKKLREKTILQLEKRLAELKKQGGKDESADQMAKRLLEAGTGDEKGLSDEAPTKEAKKVETRSNK